MEKIFSGLNLSDGWYLENIEEVDASFCPKLDYIKINMKSGTVYRLEYVEPVDIDTSGCNFFDGSVCRKIPYSLSTLNGEKIPYDWLQFIFKFKHYSEWTK